MPDTTNSRSADTRILPSRRAALARILEGLDAGDGPLLLCAEAGMGKTWLLDRLVEADERRHWVRFDLTPSLTPSRLLGLLAHRLGLPARTIASDLPEFLQMEREVGRTWALALDEAHLASDATLEEIRVLANGLGRDEGLDALVLASQPALLGRLRARALRGLDARFGARVGLGPLTLEEAHDLLGAAPPDRVRRWVREAQGRPGGVLRLRDRASVARALVLEAARAPEPEPVVAMATAAPKAAPVIEPLIPSDPPWQLDDATIEVGWAEGLADEEAEAEGASADEGSPSEMAAAIRDAVAEPEVEPEPEMIDESPQTIEDHYAALQAWNEWSRNQGRQPAASASGPDGSPAPRVRAEGQHGFAPYSSLFSR
jgi:hypothetical protein